MKQTRNQNIALRFGKAVRARRLALGISQEELAFRAGIHRTYVGDVERGVRNISLSNIHRLAVGLGCRACPSSCGMRKPMKPDSRFTDRPPDFWAYVRLVSESLGYSLRRMASLRRYTPEEITAWVRTQYGLCEEPLQNTLGETTLLACLIEYLNYRVDALEGFALPHLMDRKQAGRVFKDLKRRLKPTCLLPLNKQKGEKRHEAYLTCIVNMLTEDALGGCHFDQSPRSLVTLRDRGRVLRTLSRRYDGAYRSTVNPQAVWEVKEYYGTTTFGSRIADGVYETMLDGFELADLRASEGIHVKHYLIVDDRFTWWDCGKFYLCRIVDALHSGMVDEVIFGREVLGRWPEIVREWRQV